MYRAVGQHKIIEEVQRKNQLNQCTLVMFEMAKLSFQSDTNHNFTISTTLFFLRCSTSCNNFNKNIIPIVEFCGSHATLKKNMHPNYL